MCCCPRHRRHHAQGRAALGPEAAAGRAPAAGRGGAAPPAAAGSAAATHRPARLTVCTLHALGAEPRSTPKVLDFIRCSGFIKGATVHARNTPASALHAGGTAGPVACRPPLPSPRLAVGWLEGWSRGAARARQDRRFMKEGKGGGLMNAERMPAGRPAGEAGLSSVGRVGPPGTGRVCWCAAFVGACASCTAQQGPALPQSPIGAAVRSVSSLAMGWRASGRGADNLLDGGGGTDGMHDSGAGRAAHRGPAAAAPAAPRRRGAPQRARSGRVGQRQRRSGAGVRAYGRGAGPRAVGSRPAGRTNATGAHAISRHRARTRRDGRARARAQGARPAPRGKKQSIGGAGGPPPPGLNTRPGADRCAPRTEEISLRARGAAANSSPPGAGAGGARAWGAKRLTHGAPPAPAQRGAPSPCRGAGARTRLRPFAVAALHQQRLGPFKAIYKLSRCWSPPPPRSGRPTRPT
jgi:hypothetical protein